jgi:hypothetical protein
MSVEVPFDLALADRPQLRIFLRTCVHCNLIISTVGRPVQPEQIKKSQHQSRRVYSALDLTDAAVLVDIETEMDAE